MSPTTDRDTITIHRATPLDAPVLGTIGEVAFATNKLHQVEFPLHTFTPQQLADFRHWRTELSRSRIEQHSWKAVDEVTGRVVGYTSFAAPDAVSPDLRSMAFPEGTNVAVLNEFLDKIKAAKERCIGDRKDVWDVKSMAVHPDYHGRGVGVKLLRHGLAEVDKAGGATYLEATPAGHKLYVRCGFEDVDEIVMLDGEYVMKAMLRPAQGGQT